jgi:DNA-directed RNA polymerase subunit RPC12/RpoP
MAEQISKPYPNYHAARIRAKGSFTRIRVLQTTKEGILIKGGPLKSNPSGPTKVQTIWFPKDKFTTAQAKAWLKEHKYTSILFEPASEKSEKASYTCECIECSHTVETDKHCKDLKCSECGGQMRRKGRPGPGQKSTKKAIWPTISERDGELNNVK